MPLDGAALKAELERIWREEPVAYAANFTGWKVFHPLFRGIRRGKMIAIKCKSCRPRIKRKPTKRKK